MNHRLSTLATYYIPQVIERREKFGKSYCSLDCEFLEDLYDENDTNAFMCTLFEEFLYQDYPCAKCDAALEEHKPYQKLLEP